MDKKFFSVITPTCNSEDKIENTIRSVLSQKNKLFEYIIIDGLSTDRTIEIIKKYKKKIKFITEKDKGVYDAMNKGIEMASGKYIYFLGAGDILEKGVLEKIIKYIPDEGIYFIYGKIVKENNKNKFTKKFNKFKIIINNICHQAIFYHKEIFNILGKYSLEFPIGADNEFNIKCFGNKRIIKKYIDLNIAKFEGQGLSDNVKDINFKQQKGIIIKKNIGYFYYLLYFSLKKIEYVINMIFKKNNI